jgi:hypothetical protein
MIKYFYFFIFFFILLSCNDNVKQSLTDADRSELLAFGDSISGSIQKVFVGKVSKAIQNGGIEYAIQYCNINAMSITDSLSISNNINIYRLTNKNRNSTNGLKSLFDSLAWKKIYTEKTHFIEQDDNGAVYYFKPIYIGMPSCLKCHGDDSAINDTVRNILSEKYPNDKALGYKMNDLRGMWKIKLRDKK